MEAIRKFLNSTPGKITGAVVLVIALGALVWSVSSLFGNPAANAMSESTYICSETGKTFKVKIKPGDKSPAMSPYSNKPTGYRAETCFWTKEGQIKSEPTLVFVKRAMDPKAPPTFCPDCGRLVMLDNPNPYDGMRPPKTKEEYDKGRNREE